MSRIVLVEQATPPPVPTTGKVRVYVNTGGTLASIDDAGVVTTYAAGITQEQVEDIVGNLLQDSSSIDVTYNDAGNVVTFAVIAGGVDHDALLNFIANEHINHASVSISAGAGLTGGGDITASRTISMPNVGTAGTYKSVTTDAQGRVTAGTNPTTLAGYGITDAQPLDADLTAVAALTGSGLVTRTGAGTATTRTITAGTGVSITNGDGVSGNPTVALTNVGTAGTYGSASSVAVVTTNAQGQISSATSTPISITSTAVLDFAEAVDDRVSVLVVAGSGISSTYNDAANTLTIANTDSGTAAVATHTGLADPHPQYLTTAEGNAAYQPLDADLTAVATLAGTGLVARTAADTFTTRTVTAGVGVSVSNGDGVTGNPTVSLPNVGTSGTFGSATSIPVFTTDAQGRVSGVTPTTIAIPSTQITDFNEAAQDAVGNILADTTSIDFTYNDAGNAISAAVLPGGVNHDALQNFVANEHIDHSAVSISAGAGLTGGGDITTSQTISMPNVGTAGTYGSAAVYPVITTDAQGRVTNVTTQAVPGGSLSARTTGVLTSTSNTTFTNITGLTLTLAANTVYYVNYSIIGQSVATGTGTAFSFNGGTLTPTSVTGYVETAINGATASRLNFVSLATINTFPSCAVANQNQITNVEMVITVGATGGTLIPQFRSELNASQVTISINSSVIADPL